MKRVEEPKQDLGVVNIEEKIEKKEEIKNIKIDNHLLPKVYKEDRTTK